MVLGRFTDPSQLRMGRGLSRKAVSAGGEQGA